MKKNKVLCITKYNVQFLHFLRSYDLPVSSTELNGTARLFRSEAFKNRKSTVISNRLRSKHFKIINNGEKNYQRAKYYLSKKTV